MFEINEYSVRCVVSFKIYTTAVTISKDIILTSPLICWLNDRNPAPTFFLLNHSKSVYMIMTTTEINKEMSYLSIIQFVAQCASHPFLKKKIDIQY